jgi:nicotinamide riboside transporter PnuC
MHKIILFNGIMTAAGLIADLTGIIYMNSATVAISGAILGTIDTASYAYIMWRKNNPNRKISLNLGLFHHFPNSLILRSVSRKRHKKGVNH